MRTTNQLKPHKTAMSVAEVKGWHIAVTLRPELARSSGGQRTLEAMHMGSAFYALCRAKGAMARVHSGCDLQSVMETPYNPASLEQAIAHVALSRLDLLNELYPGE